MKCQFIPREKKIQMEKIKLSDNFRIFCLFQNDFSEKSGFSSFFFVFSSFVSGIWFKKNSREKNEKP